MGRTLNVLRKLEIIGKGEGNILLPEEESTRIYPHGSHEYQYRAIMHYALYVVLLQEII